MTTDRIFYRVQWEYSFTRYDTENGFETRRGYLTRPEFFLHPSKFLQHLNWNDRSLESTPFISVFDNERDASKRAQFMIQQGYPEVRVAEIRPGRLQKLHWDLRFTDTNVSLPSWESDSVTLFSTRDIRRHLGVPDALSQESEWFALEFIPKNIISLVLPGNMFIRRAARRLENEEATRPWFAPM